jgi:hypothetical protein
MVATIYVFLIIYILSFRVGAFNLRADSRSISKFRRSNVITLYSETISVSDKEFLGSLPAPLKRSQQDLLMKWFCKLRGLRKLSEEDRSLLSARIGVPKDKLETLTRLAMRLEQTLVKVNMRLVASIALGYTGKNMELDDLVHEGVKGLRRYC